MGQQLQVSDEPQRLPALNAHAQSEALPWTKLAATSDAPGAQVQGNLQMQMQMQMMHSEVMGALAQQAKAMEVMRAEMRDLRLAFHSMQRRGSMGRGL